MIIGISLAGTTELLAGFFPGIEGIPGVDFSKDQFVISVHRGVQLTPVDIAKNGPASTGYASLDRIMIAESVIRIAPFYKSQIKNEKLGDVVGRMFLVTTAEQGNLGSAIAAFAHDPNVEIAEPNHIYHLYYIPNDPLITSWYHLTKIDAYTAWDFIRGDSTSRPVLGIVDSGVYYDHPELEPNMWINVAEDVDGDGRFTDADINGIDDDSNGFLDDVVGYDIAMDDPIPFEPIPWHGTHVAGCASMVTDNAYGGAAVSWGARIMAVKCANDADPNTIVNGFQGITYAIDNGATVINLSWGRGGGPSQYEQNVINAAYNSGVVVVAAAGNESSSALHYPAGYNHVVAAASVDPTDHKSSFSNYGTWVDVSAPGEGIFSTWGHDGFTSLDGTSMSSPITSGIICLIQSAHPEWGVERVVGRLEETCDTIDYLNPGYRGLLGHGRVNAARAIGWGVYPLLNVIGSTLTLTSDDGDSLLNPSEDFDLTITVSNQWADADSVVGILRADSNFTVTDSVAEFGTVPGNGGSGNNNSNPFAVHVHSDASIGSHAFTVHLFTGSSYQTNRNLTIDVTLEQRGFPGNIPGNIESAPLILDFDGDNAKEILISAGDRNYYAFEANGSQTAGWPQLVSQDPSGGCAVGDLDHDGDVEVVGMARDGNIYAWESNGTLVTGFPHNCGSVILATPVLGDLDGDSNLEIVIGGFISKGMYILNHDGSPYNGWPFVGLGNIYSSVALADIDNDSLPEIIYGDFDSTLYVLNIDRSNVEGFPVRLSGQVRASPCVADIDGDGNLNIIIGVTSGDIYAFDNDGGIMPGWPFRAGGAVNSPPSLADIDSDGHLEVLAGCNDRKIYVLNSDGQAQAGFPITTGGNITASPVVGDIDGDGSPDVVFGAYDGYIYAYDYRGQLLRNFPIRAAASGQITASAGLADLDGDGDCEIVAGVKTPGNNLEVIDYKDHLPQEIFPWPFYGKDMWRTGYYGTFITGIDESVDLPKEFRLEQNYPNPFNVETIIRFSLPSNQRVDLAIYDLLGRRFRRLYSGSMAAGRHEILWNGTDDGGASAASGIYFYRLQTPSATSALKMTLIK
jgi:subtilisin family serine protease